VLLGLVVRGHVLWCVLGHSQVMTEG
jgi:hypothetical protein